MSMTAGVIVIVTVIIVGAVAVIHLCNCYCAYFSSENEKPGHASGWRLEQMDPLAIFKHTRSMWVVHVCKPTPADDGPIDGRVLRI